MFTKLFSSIITSSIWNEDNNTRLVWITMLAMANKNGYVAASTGGLAHEARVSREDCELALKVLTSPDKDSRSKEFEGRRVEVVDGGFQLLNHPKYRAMRSEEERKEYMKSYMVEYRRTKTVNNFVNNVSVCKPPLAAVSQSRSRSEAEADTEAIKTVPVKNDSYSPSFETFWTSYPKRTGKGEAWKSWKKLKPNDDLISKINVSLNAQKSNPQWLKDDGQFIPNPATWLNQRRFEDEPVTISALSKKPFDHSWPEFTKNKFASPESDED